ncbi:sialoadhesin-like [Electrophorus electricus]|uniref:sialoadhesin-like n=1 Tax=Electrophorus electricus TaxID=8005 RepID=UPI0015CFEA02|nr:sialoadhesin-like [Electrophorus electricus]
MSFRTSGNITVATIVMLLAGAQSQQSVTLSSQSLCALTGSTVKIPCKYTSSSSSVRAREWYQVQRSDGEPQDLSKDPQYLGRVSVSTWWNDCTLTMNNMNVSDSGVYNFRFRIWSSEWISASSGITLTVTDLKVTRPNTYRWRTTLNCSSTCTLPNNPTYIWYGNGQPVYNQDTNELHMYDYSGAGSYSCAVRGYEELRSPAVCVGVSTDNWRCWSVTYYSQKICSLIGSSVDLHCYYTYPNNQKVTKSFWFITEQQVGVEPVDVREEEEYEGRVQYRQSSQNDCSMTITHLRESDAHTYRFRFHTDSTAGKYTGHPGVSLSVTDLKITVSDRSSPKDLICSSTCTLPNNPTYIWYRNGQPVYNQNTNGLYVYGSSEDAGSYSCAVRGYELVQQYYISVYGKDSCWSVTYVTQSICALIGSSVDIHGYYTFPDQQPTPQPAWYARLHPQVKELSHADDRVEVFSHRANVNTLRLKHLTESDSAEYLLRFKAPYMIHTDSSAGVSLSVTGLKVNVDSPAVPGSEGQTVTLSCSSTCTLPYNPTYIWYKNGQRVSHCTFVSCSVSAVRDAVSYSCATEGHENLLSPPVYAPRNTRALMVSSGERVEGDSVTLTCSSEANPPVLIYSWFKQRAAADTLLPTGQNYSISNISSQHSGLYYCTAHNQLGQHNSTTTLLDVLYPPRNTRALMVSSGERVEGDSVTLTCSSEANPPVLTYSWFKQRAAADTLLPTGQNYSISSISSQHSGLYYCTAHNQLGQHNSTTTLLDVLYPPRVPSVTDRVSGDSVTLLCYSDSNPISNYSWYKKTGSGVILLGNSTNLTLATGAVGLFFCTAQNQFGSMDSLEYSVPTGNPAGTYAASGVTVVFFLTLIAVCLWMRGRTAAVSSRSEETSAKRDSIPVYDNVSALDMPSDPTNDGIHYSNINFTRCHTQEVSLYSTVQLTMALSQEEETEYARVNFSACKDETHIYSTISRT